MKKYSTKQRVGFYKRECGKQWPDSVPFVGTDGRIYGMWLLGQDYRNKSVWYGSYPPNFLRRVLAFFPDAKHQSTLHLFSGALPKGTKGLRVDIQPVLHIKPDIICDAHKLSELWPADKLEIDLVVADPPYSIEDCEHYGTCMIKRNVVLKECYKILRPGGWVCWLDQVMPMYKKSELVLKGIIGMMRSTNHRFRCVTFFQKPYAKGE